MQKQLQQKTKEAKPGYHLATIKKGELGEASKIREEVDELLDAEAQGCKVMAIVELADIVGAIQAYIDKKKYGVTMRDLEAMSAITKRAFVNGHRS
jgi:hypothetical protein